MTTDPERDRDLDEPAPGREPYTPPRLVRHGTIEDLTRGGVFTSIPSDPNSLG